MGEGAPAEASPGFESSRSRAVLSAFGRALRRETHVLLERPELVWQRRTSTPGWDRSQLVMLYRERLDWV